MDWNTADLNSWPAKLVTRVGHKIRSVRAGKVYSNAAVERQRVKDAEKRKQRQQSRTLSDATAAANVNELGEREYSIFSEASTLVEPTPPPAVDHTDMMHRLAHYDSFDSLVDNPYVQKKFRDPRSDGVEISRPITSGKDDERIASLPDALWQRIASYLSLADAASLAVSSKTLSMKLGQAPLQILNLPNHKHDRIRFLHRLDYDLPSHLLCFPCAKYHLRTQRGSEKLKADYVQNPLFTCPNARRAHLPRTRLVHRRDLPYAFVQLAVRAQRHSPAHGLSSVDALARRWKCRDSGWTHQTRYMVHDGRLLLRTISSITAPPATQLTETSARHLLFDREEYVPFFSVCAHWRDGVLTQVCKCALAHVPAPPDPYHCQLQRGFKVSRSAARPNFLVRGCDVCRPARRCPECPSEYLVEVQMIEDTADAVNPFKHALVVTRWTDLGDGSSPYTSPEWTAVNGLALPCDGGSHGDETGDEGGEGAYESFSHVGRRAVGGIFESRISGTIPGQRMLSLNPKNEKLGEDGHGWY